LEGFIFEMFNLMRYMRRTMNSKLWIRKALSTCLVIATMLTYSMVSLANSEKIAGEILVTGKNVSGQLPLVNVNGEAVQSGRSIFSSSTIATSENAGAIISLGKVGKIELAPNTTLALTFNEKGMSGDLANGRVTVIDVADNMLINVANGKSVALKSGESASNAPQDDTTSDNNGGSAGLVYALILGGAVAGIIIAATRGDDDAVTLGGVASVISPTR
jgi:hypothetical protein